ncbi:MAG: IS1096 element passenger TnpR family protein, partial [Hydrogenophaga sp.]
MRQSGMPVFAGVPDEDPFEGTCDPDAKKVKLRDWFGHEKACLYEYDFGDSWFHDVKLVGSVELP